MPIDFKKFLTLILFFTTLGLSAQEIVPLNRSTPGTKKEFSNKRTAEDPITLPFFDDFSISRDSINYNLWVKAGGTYLNNTSALDPPTYNVVTFDGYDSIGEPYNIGNSLFSGPADRLTSKVIDLSSYTSASNLYLSFMWQAEGLDEEPDFSDNERDSLSLLFYGKDSVWRHAWSKVGESVRDFRSAIVPISDANYLWPGFQFRFISYGNLSGGFDTWHIDYVYLNSERNAGDTITQDLAISKTPSTFLMRYSSMPYLQFYDFIEKEISNPKVYVYNLENNGLRITPTLGIKANRSEIETITILENKLIEPFSKDSITFELNPAVFKSKLPAPNTDRDSLIFNLTYDIKANDEPFYLRNDTLTVPVVFNNYYAYDDGSAEAAFKIDGRTSKVAYRFEVNTPDTLTAIDIHFPKQITDLTGKSIRLMLWKHFDVEDSLIKGLGASVRYDTLLNGFTRYTLAETDQTVLSGTFYIGYEQVVSDPIYIGFDENTNSSSEIFYKLAGSTTAEVFNKYSGSLMIRPVFGKGAIPTGVAREPNITPFKIYPNPSSGKISIDGDLDALAIYDSTGRLVFMDKLSRKSTNTFDLSIFPDGLYIFKIKKGSNIYSERVVISK